MVPLGTDYTMNNFRNESQRPHRAFRSGSFGRSSARPLGVLPGTAVRLAKPLTGLERMTTVAADGTFQLTNIPLDTYELRVELEGLRRRCAR